MKINRFTIAAIVVLAVVLYLVLDVNQYLSFSYMQKQKADLDVWAPTHYGLALLLFFSAYLLLTTFSLPGGGLLSLAGGAIFGLVVGGVAVSFASAFGACLAFLMARFLLRDFVERKFSRQMKVVNAGIEREGAFYLFSLRLVPLFPFFLINLLMALTCLRLPTFYWVSQLGMLPGTLVMVNAGIHMGQVESLRDIFSPGLVLSFTLLGLAPLIAKYAIILIKPMLASRDEAAEDRANRDEL